MTWKDIKDFEGYYQVSDAGSVRSLDRVVGGANGSKRSLKGKMKSPVPDSKGYLSMPLCRNGKRRFHRVHRLVAEAFIEKGEGKLEVRHGPNGKLDNSVGNLRWGTRSENELDKRRDGTGGPRRVVRSDEVLFNSVTEAAEATGCSAGSICNACKGKQMTTGGYRWRYLNGI